MKTCPYCSGENNNDAMLCRHCGKTPETRVSKSDVVSKKGGGCFADIVKLVLTAILFLCCAGFVLFALGNAEWIFAHIFVSFLLGVLCLCVLVGVCCWIGAASTACPACGKYFVRKELGKRILSDNRGLRTVKRHDDQYDSKGEKVGYIVRKEQVYVTTTSGARDYVCEKCGHTWTEDFSEEHEG